MSELSARRRRDEGESNGGEGGIRTRQDSLDSASYRLYNADVTVNASDAVAPCPLLPASSVRQASPERPATSVICRRIGDAGAVRSSASIRSHLPASTTTCSALRTRGSWTTKHLRITLIVSGGGGAARIRSARGALTAAARRAAFMSAHAPLVGWIPSDRSNERGRPIDGRGLTGRRPLLAPSDRTRERYFEAMVGFTQPFFITPCDGRKLR